MIQLARAFSASAPLAREVELAVNDPERYVARFGGRLRLRGVDAPVDRLASIALVDGLIARKAAAEIDHREASADLLAQLRKIVPAAARRALPAAKELDALAPAGNDVLLRVIGDRLGARKLALVEIDLGGDSYPVAVVPAARAARLAELARAAKGRIKLVRGANLAALARARAQAEAADAQRRAALQREASAGGPAWQKLVDGGARPFESIVSTLSWSDDVERQALFVAAAAEAPPEHRDRAQAIAAMLTDPVAAAARLPPLDALAHMDRLPQSERTVGPRVRALAVLAGRIDVGGDEQATTAFVRACRIYGKFRRIARAAASPADIARWQQMALARYLDARDPNAGVALLWLGDRQTLDTLLPLVQPPAADESPSLMQDLVAFLAKQYAVPLPDWPSED